MFICVTMINKISKELNMNIQSPHLRKFIIIYLLKKTKRYKKLNVLIHIFQNLPSKWEKRKNYYNY